MLVSHTKKFIYIKTVKTAGTSIEVALQDYCVPPGTDLPTDKIGGDTIQSDYGIVAARGKFVDGAEWYNHMSANLVKSQLPEDVWSGYCKVCNIRNPWDKTVSWFHFRNPGVKSGTEEEIINAFRAFMRPENEEDLTVGLDTHIYFIDGKPIGDEYIRYETLDEDFTRICEKLELQVDKIPELKRGPRGKTVIPYQKYFDAELRDKIGSLYEKEIAHFGWSF